MSLLSVVNYKLRRCPLLPYIEIKIRETIRTQKIKYLYFILYINILFQ